MNDWHQPVALLLVLPAAIGHVCQFVLLINVSSGLGYAEASMDRARFCLFAALWITSGALLWMHLHNPFWNWPWPLFAYAVLCVISGAFVLPLASLYLALRKRPEGITGSSLTVDLALEEGHEALIGPGKHSWLLRLPGHDSFRICLREWEIALPGLSPSLDGLEIVQLSDFHFSRSFERRFFERVVDRCRDWTADLLLVTGDIIETGDVIDWIEPVLSRLHARLGKFAVLGNHDHQHHPQDVEAALARSGFIVLEGRWTTVSAPAAPSRWAALPLPGVRRLTHAMYRRPIFAFS